MTHRHEYFVMLEYNRPFCSTFNNKTLQSHKYMCNTTAS